jgi:mycofactocin precursor
VSLTSAAPTRPAHRRHAGPEIPQNDAPVLEAPAEEELVEESLVEEVSIDGMCGVY